MLGLDRSLMKMAHAGRLLFIISLMDVFIHNPAWAQFSDLRQARAVTTVEQTRNARDGDRVSLTGSLANEIRRAQYLFEDETGEIRVRIEHEFWRGRTITNQNILNLRGTMRSDVRGRFIDAYYFRIVE